MVHSPLRALYGAYLAPAAAAALAAGHDGNDLRHGVEVLRARLGLLDEELAEVLVVDLGVPPAALLRLAVVSPRWNTPRTAAPLLSFSAGVARQRPEWLITAGMAAAGLGIAAGLN